MHAGLKVRLTVQRVVDAGWDVDVDAPDGVHGVDEAQEVGRDVSVDQEAGEVAHDLHRELGTLGGALG